MTSAEPYGHLLRQTWHDISKIKREKEGTKKLRHFAVELELV